MSIYQSIFGLGDEHKPRCLRIKKIEVGVYQQDDSKPCTCGSCPLKYEGSHILPSQLSKREGDFGFAGIPGHITRNGRDNGKKRWWPWLRFHLNRNTVILTKKQVGQLRDALNVWLNEQDGEE